MINVSKYQLDNGKYVNWKFMLDISKGNIE